MLFKGFRFGMLLQLAVGPVALFIFQVAALSGVQAAYTGVMGAVVVDGIFIVAAIMGIAAIIEKRQAAFILKVFGALILIVFGLSTLLGIFGFSFIPSLNLAQSADTGTVFKRAVLITASSPLTILFWAGVFSAKVAEEKMARNEIYIFGIGALLSTIFFLSVVVIFGNFSGKFLPDFAISLMNAIVGLLLIFFGVKMFFKKEVASGLS